MTLKKSQKKTKKDIEEGLTVEVEIADVYKEVISTDKHWLIIRGGRSSGKTSVIGQIIMIFCNKYPGYDMVIARDSFNSLRDSTYGELNNWIDEYKLNQDFELKLQPMRIYNKRNDCTIYFKGVGGADKNITKGFKPKHKLILVLFEETQQLKDQETLEQAHATYMRNLDDKNGKIIHLFNPEPQNAHWLNIYYKMKKLDDDWLCINTSFFDIAKFLNNVTLKSILKMAKTDPQRFEYLYLGKTGGGFGSVYPQYKADKHLIRYSDVVQRWNNDIIALIIGVDGAVTHDATCCCPLAIMRNGQGVVLNLFYHDPKRSKQLATVEQVDLMKIWFKRLYGAYNLKERNIPIIWVCDSAAADFKIQLRNTFTQPSMNMSVYSYSKPTIPEMVSVVQSALSRNMVYICDFGGHYDYFNNHDQRCENVLSEQLENLVWDDKFTGYKKSIPNDASDSFTYAVNVYYRNPVNLHWLDGMIKDRQDYYNDDK